jgi:hypothetical protein
MQFSAHAHHRRAAYAALQPVLGDDESVQALAWLHERLRSDSVADVIAFVDAVATRHRLDDATRRRLYASLHAALRVARADLPPDPWPAMQAARGRPGSTAPWQVEGQGARPWTGVRWPNANARAHLRPDSTPAPALVETDSAAQAVFGALMAALLGALATPTLAPVRNAGLAHFEHAHVSPVTRETACAAWHQAGPDAWCIPGSLDELGELVHQFYLALCEVVGPDEADRLLANAARVAGRLPQARECPPGKLL